jgi:4-hydroxy-L-threonine phosphate dehydrogenase PdxA
MTADYINKSARATADNINNNTYAIIADNINKNALATADNTNKTTTDTFNDVTQTKSEINRFLCS